MREFVVSHSLNLIKQDNPEYSDEKMEVLRYGLEGLYILISKSIIIFSIAYFLGIFWELLIFMLIYNLIRTFSFGVHASSSTICLIASAFSFISMTYLCKNVAIPQNIKVILGFLGIICIFKYSPADTEKRPIINSKRRFIYKTLSVIIAITMVICSITIEDTFISNSFVIALIIQSFMTSPLAYRLFNQKYDNYKKYLKN